MTAQLAPRPGTRSRRPQLRAVPGRSARMATIPFVAVVAVILALGMVGMLVLATALQGQAFTLQDRQRTSAALDARVSQLEAQSAEAQSVKSLAIAAAKLGMRPDPYAVPLRLSDGKVLGTARVVAGNELPDVRYLTPEQAAAVTAALKQAEADRIARKKAEAAAKKAEAAKQAADAAAARQAADAAKKTGAGTQGVPR